MVITFLRQHRFKVNEHVAAANQVRSLRRRIFQQVVGGQKHTYPVCLVDLVTTILFIKKTAEGGMGETLSIRFGR